MIIEQIVLFWYLYILYFGVFIYIFLEYMNHFKKYKEDNI